MHVHAMLKVVNVIVLPVLKHENTICLQIFRKNANVILFRVGMHVFVLDRVNLSTLTFTG